jgi:beta-glucosidase
MVDLLSSQQQGSKGAGSGRKSPHEIDVEASRPLFDWGVASSAYQIEGAWNLDGKGPSIWDAFSHTPGKVRGRKEGALEREREREREEGKMREKSLIPEQSQKSQQRKKKVHNNETGDVACDFYHLYSKDIAMMKSLGAKSFRFSLSWSRLLPEGRGRVNEEGFRFYERVLDALDEAGIEPHVTLYHW